MNLHFRTDEERQRCKKYSIGFQTFTTDIEIPLEFDTDDVFQPTLGHKVFWDNF